ncbi:MAG: glycosyltransferase [Candidatus Omnitrophota bacterium]|nr:glycosyltransferase [Candidatus Omnitrophota bacterium]
MQELAPTIETVAATSVVCTIATKRQLGHVRVFAETLRKHEPARRILVLLTDRIESCFDPLGEGFEIILIEDLDTIPDPRSFFFKYNEKELQAAVRPYFFDYLLTRCGVGNLVFCDPAVAFFGPMDTLWKLLERHPMVLELGIMEPYYDHASAGEILITHTSVSTLGFVALKHSASTTRFLDWWKEKSYDHRYENVERGFHMDEEWVNFALFYCEDIHVIRDPAYITASWNVWHRGKNLKFEANQVSLNGNRVSLFHFNAFERKQMWDSPAEDLLNLERLFADYRSRLNAVGQSRVKRWVYAFDRFDNGARIPQTARELYRKTPDAAARFGNPFAAAGMASYFNFLSEPDSGIPRLFREIHESRPDLQQAFPDPEGQDKRAFLRWTAVSGRVEYGLDPAFYRAARIPYHSWRLRLPRLLEAAILRWKSSIWPEITNSWQKWIWKRRTMQGRGLSASETCGVNIIGYLQGEFGIAEATRCYIAAVKASGVPSVLKNVSAPHHSNRDSSIDLEDTKHDYPIQMVNVNFDRVYSYWREQSQGKWKKKYQIGVWFWELAEFPNEWLSAFRYYREIWVASTFCQEAIAAISPIPVLKMDIPILFTKTEIQRERFGWLPDEMIFLFCFDFSSFFERKNVLGLVEAFRKAFGPDERVRLVIKSINSDASHRIRGQRELLGKVAEGLRVQFIDECLERKVVDGLMNSCDCYVSLHRSEGFGLPLAQAMALGKPVIATRYGGNTEFMTPENSFLVDYKLTELEGNFGPYHRGAVWAEPDTDHAAQLMRYVYENREAAQVTAFRAAEDMRRFRTPEICGKKIKARLNLIHDEFLSD